MIRTKTGASVWNGETNNFFNLMELAFPEEKIASMRKSMTAMQTLGGLKSGNDLEKLFAFYQKYYFDQAQEYFPANAYNADAKYCYENGKLAYNKGHYSNDTDPITQSLGRPLSCGTAMDYRNVFCTCGQSIRSDYFLLTGRILSPYALPVTQSSMN